MRWLILTDDYPPCDGGVATWTAAVAGELARTGDDVTVLARHRQGLSSDQPLLTVIPVQWPSFGRWGAMGLALSALRHPRPDALLATTWGVARFIAPWLRFRQIPLHIVAHGSDVTRGLGPDFDATVAGARLWAVSEFLAEILRQRGHACKALPAPVRSVNEHEPRIQPRHWLFVGRATRLKGGDRFVRWVAAARDLGVHGTVVGDGPERRVWEQLARDMGAHIVFRGRLAYADTLAAYATADLVVLPSRADTDGSGAEGLGLVAIEAALAGVPAVGTRVGGIPEAVGPGLILDDPDDANGSVQQIFAWWNAERGPAARAWGEARHGVGLTVGRVRGAR